MLERTMHGIPKNNLECKVENPSLVVHYCKNIKAKKSNNIETWDARVPTLYIFPHWRYSHSLYIQHAVHHHINPIPAGVLENQDMLGKFAKFIFCKIKFFFKKCLQNKKCPQNVKIYISEKPLTMPFQICKNICKILNNLMMCN